MPIWLIWSIVVLIVGWLTVSVILDQRREGKLRREGLPAIAKVVSVKQTGTWIGNNPQVEMELQVQPAEGDAYVLKHEEVVPIVNLVAIQPGATIRIRVAADDPQQIVFDEAWAR
ncbi:MAG: hypothetical protein HY308_04060 [Gammaproteobacteria bacterium]|nr:hypothetical protein [Gammaproteobacteria bacterium]